MDKLQPIIKHRFWILSVLAVILITVGWYMGVGKLQTMIDERKGAIDAAETAAKSVGQNPPNESWVTAVSAILKEKEAGLKKTEQVLFEEQKQLRFYPPQVTANMQRVLAEAGKNQKELEYRQQPPPKLISLYRTDYFEAVDRVIAGLEPYNAGNIPLATDPGANLYKTIPPGEGKVYINWQTPPFETKVKWLGNNSQPPTPKEFWDSLEDLWLIDALFKSINRVNEGYRNVTDAPIKQIDQLLLRGGNMEEVIARKNGGGAPAAPSGDGMSPEMMEYAPMNSPFENGGDENMMGQKGADTKIDYDLTVDFGSDADTSAAQSAPADGMNPMAMSRGRQAQARKRYVEDQEGKPYRTRAFALKVVMDETKMPELIHQLRSSPWPIHIYRVHRADYNQATFGPAQSYGGEYGAEMSPEMNVPNPMDVFTQPMGSPFQQSFAQPGQTHPGQEARTKLKAALTDPLIIQVLITGTITMYKSPVVAEEVGTETTPTPDPNAQPAQPVDPNAAPADPNAKPVDPNAQPVDPNAAPADPNAQPTMPVPTPENPLPGNVPMPAPVNPLPGNVPMPTPENAVPNPAPPAENPGTVPPATPSETTPPANPAATTPPATTPPATTPPATTPPATPQP